MAKKKDRRSFRFWSAVPCCMSLNVRGILGAVAEVGMLHVPEGGCEI